MKKINLYFTRFIKCLKLTKLSYFDGNFLLWLFSHFILLLPRGSKSAIKIKSHTPKLITYKSGFMFYFYVALFNYLRPVFVTNRVNKTLQLSTRGKKMWLLTDWHETKLSIGIVGSCKQNKKRMVEMVTWIV